MGWVVPLFCIPLIFLNNLWGTIRPAFKEGGEILATVRKRIIKHNPINKGSNLEKLTQYLPVVNL